MKALVTGANGFVGRHVVKKLLEIGSCDIIATSLEAQGSCISKDPRIKYISKDLTETGSDAYGLFEKPDMLIQCGWSQIFKKRILEIPSKFCIGIHPSPLPIGRGAAILNWKLIEGGGEWGNTLFIMSSKTDVGDILDFEPFILEPRDSIYTAYLKADRTAIKMIKRTIPKIIDGSFVKKEQKANISTRYYKRSPKDGLIDVTWGAEKIINYVRALTKPFPGAILNTSLGDMIVWDIKLGDISEESKPGTILDIVEGRGLLLNVGDKQSVWLTLITPPGDFECWVDEWAIERGLNIGQEL